MSQGRLASAGVLWFFGQYASTSMQFHTLSAGGAPQGRPATFCAACAAKTEWQTALGPVRSQQPCRWCFCDISGGWIEAQADLSCPVSLASAAVTLQ